MAALCWLAGCATGISEMEWRRSGGAGPGELQPDRLRCMEEVADTSRPITPGFTGNTVPATQLIYDKTRRDHMTRCMRDLGWSPAG